MEIFSIRFFKICKCSSTALMLGLFHMLPRFRRNLLTCFLQTCFVCVEICLGINMCIVAGPEVSFEKSKETKKEYNDNFFFFDNYRHFFFITFFFFLFFSFFLSFLFFKKRRSGLALSKPTLIIICSKGGSI